VLSRIWLPDLFLLSGDSQFLLGQLDQISQLDIFMSLPILIVTSSAIAELEWLKARFHKLRLYECADVYGDGLESSRSQILLNLYQAINDALR
jgi:hypothetical protein